MLSAVAALRHLDREQRAAPADAGTPERMFLDTPDYVHRAIDKVVANTAGQVSIKSTLRVAPTLSIE